MRFAGNDAAGHVIEEDALTTKKLADNAISYLATASALTLAVTTHGSIENPTTLIVITKAIVGGLSGEMLLTLSLDGLEMDSSRASYTGATDLYATLTAQFMATITDSNSHTILMEVTAGPVLNAPVINVLEMRR